MRPPIDEIFRTALQLHRAGKLAEADDLYQQILRRRADHADALYYRGAVAHQQGRDEQAIDWIRRAILIKPNYPKAHFNLGIALRNTGRFDEAVEALRQAIVCEPDLAQAHFILSALLLSKGEFLQGFAEYEWRWKCPGFSSVLREFKKPRWDGGDLSGRTILIHDEQGLGDTLQFVRYVPLVAERGAKVILGCDPALRSLLGRSLGEAQMMDWNQPLPEFDYHCPLLSLPLVFGTTIQTIPRSVPYVSASPEGVARWRQRLAADINRCKVGLVWAGKSTHPNDRNRSLALSVLAPLAQVQGVSFYSLQKGEASKQLTNLPPGFALIDLTDGLHNFDDTAALIANLDLVISVDTSVVHLAGAMGKPVWTLLPFVADWRWMQAGEETPWYPTMKLFRQSLPGDWISVVGRVVESLSGFVESLA